MISFLLACCSQVLRGANFAAVCSRPPSLVGMGITASFLMGRPWDVVVFVGEEDEDRGRK